MLQQLGRRGEGQLLTECGPSGGAAGCGTAAELPEQASKWPSSAVDGALGHPLMCNAPADGSARQLRFGNISLRRQASVQPVTRMLSWTGY